MNKRLLTMMCILAAAPVAAQDGDAEAGADVDAEASAGVSADVDVATDADANAGMGGDMDTDADMGGDADGMSHVDTDMGGGGVLAYTERGMTLREGTLRIDLGPADRALLQYGGSAGALPLFLRGGGFVVSGFNFSAGPVSVSETAIDIRVGAAFGIMDGLEVGAMVLPLGLSPSGRDAYGNPSIYGRFRILDGSFQLGAQVAIAIPAQSGTDLGLGFAVPIKVFIGDNVHLNTGVELNLTLADPDAIIGLNIPLELAFNITESIFMGVVTGANQPNLDVSTTFIPLGLFGGYTMAVADNMVLDATVDFSFPGFVNTTSGADNPFTDFWQLTVGGVMRMDLTN